MFDKDLQIKKYPFLAKSPNLMEYFSIIGYNENFVPKILDSYKKMNNEYPPIILSSITSGSDYGIIDNKLIIGQVYPDNPITILINKNDVNQEPPPTSNVIYSFCYDSTDGKQKLFYVCYAFKFYEKYKHFITQTIFEEYYIPKAFCIISQYYYFTLFEYICKNIYTLMTQEKKNKSFPIELTIYNIVNFTPSPINYRLNLSLFSYIFPNLEDIQIEQLSGYPYLDFNLSEIFNLLPINIFIEIYILTIIEQSMLFFSSNLEILNMVMFILFILNYPCNNSQYFWQILSVSKNNFVDENQFVGKRMTTLLGVNTTYSEDFDTSVNGNFHFIVDIDNKKIIIFKKAEITEKEEIDYDNLNNLHIYIQNIIKEKDKNIDNSFLKILIGMFKRYLNLILTKNKKYTSNPKNKYVNFFKTSKEIMETNRKIQEICYDFYLNILMIFYQDFSFNSSFDKLKNDDINESIKKFNKLRNLDDNTQLIKEEETFCNYFRNSFKYKIYFENFIQDSVSIDIYKIPFIYTDEFINIKIKNNPNILIYNFFLFKIIDLLYLPEQQITLNITLNNIYMHYSEKFEKKFKHFFTSERSKAANRRQLMVLNKKIINKYIYLLNNYCEEQDLKDLFPSMQIQERNEIFTVNKRIIINSIEKTFENNNQIEPSHYLIYSFVYIFSIFIPLHSYKKMLSYINFIIKSLEKIKYFKRQYIYILIKSFYKYYLIHKEKLIYPDICISNIKMYYYMFINFLNENLIIPNEEMMAIINLFFSQIIYQERNSIKLEKDKDFDHSKTNFEIEKGKNFLCFIKYSFIKYKICKPETVIKKAMKIDDFNNVEIKNEKHNLKPIIQIKIKDYIYSSYIFPPKKIYNLSKFSYNNFFDNTDLDMNKLNLTNIRDIITNLIQYRLVLKKNDDFLLTEYLIYTLYFLKDFEEKNNK